VYGGQNRGDLNLSCSNPNWDSIPAITPVFQTAWNCASQPQFRFSIHRVVVQAQALGREVAELSKAWLHVPLQPPPCHLHERLFADVKIALSSMSDRTRLSGAILVTYSRLPCIASGESLSCPVGNGHGALGALLPGLDAATCRDSGPRIWGRFVIQPCCRSGISRIVHSYERALDLLSILSFRPSVV
jgi:hypothetical protein